MAQSLPAFDESTLVLAADLTRAAESLVLAWARAEDAVHMQISAAQLRVLMTVNQHGSLNLTQLAEELGTIPSWASRLCDRLVAADYLERRASDQDRREVSLGLRRQGRLLLAELESRRRDALAETLSGMSITDRRALARGLQAFARVADRTSKQREEPA